MATSQPSAAKFSLGGLTGEGFVCKLTHLLTEFSSSASVGFYFLVAIDQRLLLALRGHPQFL